MAEHMGHMFDDILRAKPTFADRLDWFVKDLRGLFFSARRGFGNVVRWLPTVWGLYPWEGFSTCFVLIEKHLKAYLAYVRKHGHSTDEYVSAQVKSINAALKLMKRVSEPKNYDYYYRRKVDALYPDYLSHITHNPDGSTTVSGQFVPLGGGWVGEESGRDPRRGYFEFVGGTLTQLEPPDMVETERLLAQIDEYDKAIRDGYKQAHKRFERDLAQLGRLLRDNMYTWWD